jgi:hypothetical protein
MNIALCLFGYPKGSTIYAGQGQKENYKHLFDQVMVHDPDVFIHCWDKSLEKETIDLFNPKKVIFQEQLLFENKIAQLDMSRFSGGRGDIFKTLSFLYTRKKSNDLRLLYESETGKKYDCVVTSRFDVGYHNYGKNKTSYINFDPTLEMDSVYSAYWNQINAGLSDHWFYGNSHNISIICNLFDHVLNYLSKDSEYINEMMKGCFDTNRDDWFSNEFFKTKKTKNLYKYKENYCLNNHCLYKWHFYKNNLWNKNKCKFLNRELWND